MYEYGMIVLIALLLLIIHALQREQSQKRVKNPYAVALEELSQKNYPVGYFSETGKFVKLSGVYIQGTHMYCLQNGYAISVSHRIAKDKGLPKARWLDHVHIQIYSTYHELYILLRDYVALREQVAIT
jgi:hypothetical protein